MKNIVQSNEYFLFFQVHWVNLFSTCFYNNNSKPSIQLKYTKHKAWLNIKWIPIQIWSSTHFWFIFNLSLDFSVNFVVFFCWIAQGSNVKHWKILFTKSIFTSTYVVESTFKRDKIEISWVESHKLNLK